jgi:hypothetical protein
VVAMDEKNIQAIEEAKAHSVNQHG